MTENTNLEIDNFDGLALGRHHARFQVRGRVSGLPWNCASSSRRAPIFGVAHRDCPVS